MSDNFTPLSTLGALTKHYTPTSAADINLYTYTHNVVVACYFSHCYRQCTHSSARYKLSFSRRLLVTGWDKGHASNSYTTRKIGTSFHCLPSSSLLSGFCSTRTARYLDLIDEHLLQCERSAVRESEFHVDSHQTSWVDTHCCCCMNCNFHNTLLVVQFPLEHWEWWWFDRTPMQR